MLKKAIIAVLTTVPLVLGGVAVTAAPASASGYNCVDSYEWRHFGVGSGKSYTERLFDTRGWTKRYGNGTWTKRYTACGAYYDYIDVKYRWNGYRWVVQNAWRYY